SAKPIGQRLKFGARGGKLGPLGPRAVLPREPGIQNDCHPDRACPELAEGAKRVEGSMDGHGDKRRGKEIHAKDH
ncbi:MAG: hypothetical protein JW828_10500, partial [Sedimentisphaerales bacterium]|nr:hypothetical protein [Sedimentisphaerales bacterium]